MEYETNRPSAPQAEQTPPPAAPQLPQKVRRVGTFAFGLVLIAAGVLLIAKILVPGFDLYTVAKFSPVVLIVLGVEVLIYAARPNVKLKYDFLSMFGCAFILVVVGVSSLLPALWNYYGPAHELQMNQLRRQLEDEALEALDAVPEIGNLVRNVDFNVWWSEGALDSSITDLHQAQDQLDTQANFILTRSCGSAEEFAAACKTIIDACTQAEVPLQRYYFTTRNNNYETGPLVDYSLDVNSRWLARADAAALADCVTVSWYEDGNSFDSEQEYRYWLAEHEAERIAATAETAMEESEAYQNGYEDGYDAAREEQYAENTYEGTES